MADDNILRSYRSNDSNNSNTSRAEGHDVMSASDPLAELARLIGQNDSFVDSARPAPRSGGGSAAGSIPVGDQPPVGDWRRHIARPDYESMHDAPELDPYVSSPDPQGTYQSYSYSNDPHDPHDPHGGYADEWRAGAPADGYRKERRYETGHSYGIADDYAGQSQIDPSAVPMAPGALGDEGYDDPPHHQMAPTARTHWLSTAVMLVGCALIGTTGAYGYRHFLKPAAGAKSAPVIVADNVPSKIIPSSAEQKSSRSQDRVPGGTEQLVSREEQPVTLQPPASQAPAVTEVATAAPALQAIPPVASSPPTAPASPAAAQPEPDSPAVASAPSRGPNAPKRIRTVTIRPEGGDSSARPVPPRGALHSGPQTTAAVPQPSRAAPRGAPLSLDPSAQANEPVPSQQAPAAPSRRQTSAPDAWTPAPRESRGGGPKLASAPSNGHGGGGYLVQVSSQRTESDARASFRGLQAKYSQLKSRQPLIRRADLGSRGTYYRAMVGPFGSAHEADQFCGGLKRSGGQCIILRN
jgi:hypothetical protein